MFEQLRNLIVADIAGLVVQIFFAITIIFMILDKQKPPLSTSILTGVALIVLGIGGSYHAILVSAGTILNGILWLILAIQRYRQKLS